MIDLYDFEQKLNLNVFVPLNKDLKMVFLVKLHCTGHISLNRYLTFCFVN